MRVNKCDDIMPSLVNLTVDEPFIDGFAVASFDRPAVEVLLYYVLL